ncbi:hypothetical protein F4808DRAFT_378590 [Astrocystis sublimbata]|nr:hypothetical protein F4808DRAFT_378590 [Astrocystis sublimbata]
MPPMSSNPIPNAKPSARRRPSVLAATSEDLYHRPSSPTPPPHNSSRYTASQTAMQAQATRKGSHSRLPREAQPNPQLTNETPCPLAILEEESSHEQFDTDTDTDTQQQQVREGQGGREGEREKLKLTETARLFLFVLAALLTAALLVNLWKVVAVLLMITLWLWTFVGLFGPGWQPLDLL